MAINSTNPIVQKAMNAIATNAASSEKSPIAFIKSADGKSLKPGDFVKHSGSGMKGQIIGVYNDHLWDVRYDAGFTEETAPSDLIFIRHGTAKNQIMNASIFKDAADAERRADLYLKKSRERLLFALRGEVGTLNDCIALFKGSKLTDKAKASIEAMKRLAVKIESMLSAIG